MRLASATSEVLSDARDLNYTARAGLLPELSRQTYDAFYKALREVILNSLDAEASEVTLDFSRIREGEIAISDDGTGMTSDELQDSFLSLGGSAKFGEQKKFGRIGIGSLALLHYGASATIETKVASSAVVTHATLEHPWALDRHERSRRLDGFRAGSLSEARYVGPASDHFTIIRLQSVSNSVISDCSDVARFYALVDRLRSVLPLPWAESPLTRALEEQDPAAWAVLQGHVHDFTGGVRVKSIWGVIPRLERRVFGEEADEHWDGAPRVIYKVVPVPDASRSIAVAAYLLSQSHASPRWAGLTARVQNVAVEERTFFDVESDPGFRKYLTGEAFIFGDVDRARLINIDRASFNRECSDYRVVQRMLSEEIVRFKAERIQSPRRAKVTVRRRAESLRSLLLAVQSACDAASRWCEAHDIRGVSSSGIRVPRQTAAITLDSLFDDGTTVAPSEALAPDAIDLSLDDDGRTPRITVGRWLWAPRVSIGENEYGVTLIDSPSVQPVVVRQRPRELIVNTGHPAVVRGSASAVQSAVLLEIALLVDPSVDALELYDRVLELTSLL